MPWALMGPVREALDAGGAIAAAVEGFRPRTQQQAMAELVRWALEGSYSLVVEAGTGVGKTFAYLVPALTSGRRVIVSTGTKYLQDQLYRKDLPVVRRALEVPVRTALLKGRANYLCLHRLEEASERLQGRAERRDLGRIRDWARHTQWGDIAELGAIAEDAPLWATVTSTVDNCLGAECPDYARCHVVKARRLAQEADLVVVNHHLFLADLALKEEGFGEVLPSADAYILDEAHQLPEIASDFFGLRVSARALLDLAADVVAEQLVEAPDQASLRDRAEALRTAVLALRAGLGEGPARGPWQDLGRRPRVAEALERLETELGALSGALEATAERGRGLKQCRRRALALAGGLEQMGAQCREQVQWYELFRRGFVLHATPLDPAGIFREHMQRYSGAWVFTSATLTVGRHFDSFTRRLGLHSTRCERLDSPYDYHKQALAYLPQGLPGTGDPGYTPALVEAAVPVIEASGGRSFMLFTSHRALREAAERLAGRLAYPLLIQGTAPRRELIERFHAAGDAVLLGTASFWEGVDVRGPALSCVIIDKLPFASPGDPVMQARIEAIRARGGNPFTELQIPQAVIALKQGVGRLIRDERDTGVLMLCDPRLLGRPYGRIFLNSLPPMPRTRDLRQVQAFLRACDEARAGLTPPAQGGMVEGP
jgi:ATP-dependent DNA helicase DinG